MDSLDITLPACSAVCTYKLYRNEEANQAEAKSLVIEELHRQLLTNVDSVHQLCNHVTELHTSLYLISSFSF